MQTSGHWHLYHTTFLREEDLPLVKWNLNTLENVTNEKIYFSKEWVKATLLLWKWLKLKYSTKFEKLEIGENKQLYFLVTSEKNLKEIIKPLFQNATKKKHDSVYPTELRPGILYASAKVHKPVIDYCPSFRPILSAIGIPIHNLAKFLVPILSPLTVNKFTVHDSLSFPEGVVKFDAYCIMASLDLESFFINIPLDKTIENCINDLISEANALSVTSY